jgi:hypothetical protein
MRIYCKLPLFVDGTSEPTIVAARIFTFCISERVINVLGGLVTP